jgi:hypothetical protein
LSSHLLSKSLKIKNIQNHNFICWFVWVWNLVSCTERRTWMKDVWEQDAEENIWTWEGGRKELHNLYASPYIMQVIKSRNFRMAEHVACMGEMRNS